MGISTLWAKKAKEDLYWLPLDVHLTDTAEVAKKLWRKWLPEIIQQSIANSIGADQHEAEKLFIFLAAAHDIGKATPVFQAKLTRFPATDLDEDIRNKLLENGFTVRENRDEYDFYAKTPHALASQLLLENAKNIGISETNLCRNAAVILGSHHGKPPDNGYYEVIEAYKSNFGRDEKAWMMAQSELIRLALQKAGYKKLEDVPSPSMTGQVLLCGLLIMADWIASDTGKFSLVPVDYPQINDQLNRIQTGWQKLSLTGTGESFMIRNDEGLYKDRFGYDPNNMQKAVLQAANSLDKPGIMLIEAPMGLGKTEAALVVAELFRNKTNSNGLFFALPTQATSDGIFPRLTKWIDKSDFNEKRSIRLAHGKAQFNDDYLKLFEGVTEIYDEDGEAGEEGEEHAAFVHQWFNGRKKAMLADFVVGTIDQLLLMALKQKHVMLRHLGLAGKVIIIDECHAYDAYMSQYLKIALRWLGTYGAPVIVLSATLPVDKRRELIGAYLGNENINGDWAKSLSYPLITFTDGDQVKSLAVEPEGKNTVITVKRMAVEEVADNLEELLSEGGCAGVIMDTVRRAQDMARTLRQRFGAENVQLIHSRFLAKDRIEKEKKLRDALGRKGQRPEKLIVVGTQVLEQSLDIDFDVMTTDIAPMDLLLQRLGRLHRHDRGRPQKLSKPVCFVTGVDGKDFEKGIDSVYHKYLLIRTRDLLDNHGELITLPEDIAPLVNAAYDSNAELTKEKEDWEAKTGDKVSRANAFCMREPSHNKRASLINWLNTDLIDDPTGKKGEATVRDIEQTIEVLLIKNINNKYFLTNGKQLPVNELSEELAKMIATQSVSLPRELCYPRIIDQVIKELEAITNKHVSNWQESLWLAGELFLILDSNNSVSLCGYQITYTSEDGLVCTKESMAND